VHAEVAELVVGQGVELALAGVDLGDVGDQVPDGRDVGEVVDDGANAGLVADLSAGRCSPCVVPFGEAQDALGAPLDDPVQSAGGETCLECSAMVSANSL
jgi:hypothetical protein